MNLGEYLDTLVEVERAARPDMTDRNSRYWDDILSTHRNMEAQRERACP